MVGEIVVTWEGKKLGFLTESRQGRSGMWIVDATTYFDAPEFKDPKVNWSIAKPRVLACILHHAAGWYGPRLTENATPTAEFAFVLALARDHRERFGIGPGYNYIAFPSGRAWAVGRHGTHRAHTKGRDPATLENWNVVGRSVCAAGDLSAEPMTNGLARAITAAVADIGRLPGAVAGMPVYEHGLIPTVNSAGVRYSQATDCPGRNLSAWRAAGGLVSQGEPVYEPDRWGEGYVAGYRSGFGMGAAEGSEAHQEAAEAAQARVAALITAPPVPAHVPAAPAVSRDSLVRAS